MTENIHSGEKEKELEVLCLEDVELNWFGRPQAQEIPDEGGRQTNLRGSMMMRASWVRILAASLLASAALSMAFHSAVSAKSYRISGVEIDAHLRPDGNMDVSEARTYTFSGSFSFAYRDMPRGGRVTFDDFEVLENGRPYVLSDSEAPGTYQVTGTTGRTRVTWYYRAADESRTFEFRYRALNAVQRYEDAALLYYKFLSEDWEKSQSNITLRVVPPGPVARADINEWLHGPLWAESRITADGEILAQCSHLPGRTYLEIRALYPPELFPGARSASGAVRSEVMAEEAAWVEEANKVREASLRREVEREKREKAGRWLTALLALAGLLGWRQIYMNYGRRPQLPQFMDKTSEVPGGTPPALVGYLLHNRMVSGRDLVGTMLDLARRGFVELREETVEKKSLWGGMKQESEYYWDLKRRHLEQHAAALREYERDLLQFLFDNLAAGGDSISLDGIKKKRRDFIKFFGGWKKKVSELGEKEEWFDRESIRGSYFSVALGVAMILLSIGAAFIFGVWTIVLGIAGIVVFVLSFLVYHRTAEGETRARQWQALQKYLKSDEFRALSRGDILTRVSDYLVYGVVLGMSNKFYRGLAAAIPENDQLRYVPWYVYHGSGTNAFSPEAFGEAFSSMVVTTTSTMSTASGAGGGASGGGGGGAGSGGGGAG